MEITQDKIRNIAIIAHVDHGKTTLVDEMLKQSGTYRDNEKVQVRVMDSNDLEKERGITILAKNTSVNYKDYKINIVDTPGHADFSGEVERVLQMVEGVLLLVDAFEGPMPQTRFVLKKALDLGHKVIVVMNKIDRHDARPEGVIDEILELLIDLEADQEHIDCPFIYASARQGTSSYEYEEQGEDLIPLFDSIIKYIPAPSGELEKPFQMLVSTIDYNEYVGRIAIGKIARGTINVGQDVSIATFGEETVLEKIRVTSLYSFDGLKRTQVQSASVGDIVAVSGIPNINIGDTICAMDAVEPLPFVSIGEPTMSMMFSVNDSPFAGREGKFITSRQLRTRLYKEIESDVSLHVKDGETADSFIVSGRGELHLSILVETMRREGFEFQVSKPVVLFKEVNGILSEPIETVIIDVLDEYSGTVINKLNMRRGEMQSMVTTGTGRTRIEYKITSRGFFGYRSEFLTDTRGDGILNSVFGGFEPLKGSLPSRTVGALVAFESGMTVTYGLFNTQGRGILFVDAGVEVYTGMVVGENAKQGDMDVNVCKKKQLTNMRASGSDDEMRLTPSREMSLERAMEWIEDDELIEVTPKNIRIRKKILDSNLRYRANRKK